MLSMLLLYKFALKTVYSQRKQLNLTAADGGDPDGTTS